MQGLPLVDSEQNNLPMGKESRQAAALQQSASQQETAGPDTLSQWSAEHIQQSDVSTYFFPAGLLMLGLSTALFLYYSCSRMCQVCPHGPIPPCCKSLSQLTPAQCCYSCHPGLGME